MGHTMNMAVTFLFSPMLQRRLRRAQLSDIGCRRISTVFGFLVPAICFLILPRARTATEAALCFTAALGFFALHPSGFKANYMDVTLTRGGLVSGVGNTIASIASSAGPLIVARSHAMTGGWGQASALVS